MIFGIIFLGMVAAFLFAISLIPQKSPLTRKLEELESRGMQRDSKAVQPFDKIFSKERRGHLLRKLMEAGWYTVTPARMGLRMAACGIGGFAVSLLVAPLVHANFAVGALVGRLAGATGPATATKLARDAVITTRRHGPGPRRRLHPAAAAGRPTRRGGLGGDREKTKAPTARPRWRGRAAGAGTEKRQGVADPYRNEHRSGRENCEQPGPSNRHTNQHEPATLGGIILQTPCQTSGIRAWRTSGMARTSGAGPVACGAHPI